MGLLCFVIFFLHLPDYNIMGHGSEPKIFSSYLVYGFFIMDESMIDRLKVG